MQLQKISTLTKFVKFTICLYSRLPFSGLTILNHTRKFLWQSNLNEPERKNFIFIITQLSEVEIQQSSELL